MYVCMYVCMYVLYVCMYCMPASLSSGYIDPAHLLTAIHAYKHVNYTSQINVYGDQEGEFPPTSCLGRGKRRCTFNSTTSCLGRGKRRCAFNSTTSCLGRGKRRCTFDTPHHVWRGERRCTFDTPHHVWRGERRCTFDTPHHVWRGERRCTFDTPHHVWRERRCTFIMCGEEKEGEHLIPHIMSGEGSFLRERELRLGQGYM